MCPRERLIGRLFIITLSTVIFATPVVTQVLPLSATEETMTNFGGKNTISGVLLGPDGRPYNRRVAIRLISALAGEVNGYTDSEGRFSFTKVVNGSYTVTVEEDQDHGFASATLRIDLPNRAPPQDFLVQLRLSEKRNTGSKPAVVDADMASVPKDALNLYEKSLELAKAGDHKGAIQLLQQAVSAYPSFLAAFNELGVQYLATGELEKADAALVSALQLKPDAFQALMNRGIVLIRLNRSAEAEPLLQQATKVNSSSALAFLYLGRTQLTLKEYDAAQQSLKTAIDLGGDQVKEAHRSLAKVYVEKKDYAHAADELQMYLKLNPTAHDAEQLRMTLAQLRSAAQGEPTPAKPL